MATPVIAFNQLANDIESDGMNPNHAERVLPASDVEWIARIVWASQ